MSSINQHSVFVPQLIVGHLNKHINSSKYHNTGSGGEQEAKREGRRDKKRQTEVKDKMEDVELGRSRLFGDFTD